jgi:hypothetical protein
MEATRSSETSLTTTRLHDLTSQKMIFKHTDMCRNDILQIVEMELVNQQGSHVSASELLKFLIGKSHVFKTKWLLYILFASIFNNCFFSTQYICVSHDSPIEN